MVFPSGSHGRDAGDGAGFMSRRQARERRRQAASTDVGPVDLWSLPADPDAPSAGDQDDHLVAAWMDALSDEPSPSGGLPGRAGGRLPGVGPIPLLDPVPAGAGHDDGWSGGSGGSGDPPRARSSGASLRTLLVALVASLVLALIGVTALAQVAQPATGAGAPAAPAVTSGTDDRVVLVGRSPTCLTLLVKPLPSGVTNATRGTCFVVG